MLRWFLRVMSNRDIQVVVGGFYLVLLPSLLVYLLHEYGFQPLSIIVIEVVLTATITLLVERVISSPRGIAFIAANDVTVSLAASALLIIIGVAASFQEPGVIVRPSTRLIPPAAATVLYFAFGLLLGASLRRLLATLLFKALFGQPRFLTALSLASLWFLTAAIALLPVHPNSIPPFLLGVGAGIFLHEGLGLRLARSAAAYRRLFEVQSSIPDTLPLAETERIALKLLASGRQFPGMRFTKLRTHLTNCRERNAMSQRLLLLSSCAWRLEGRYNDAIDDTEVAHNPPIDILDAQLLLVRALSLEDQGDAVDEKIDDLLTTLASSPPGSICPLTRALIARRSAERCIDHRGNITFNKEALGHVVASLDLRRSASALLEQTQAGVRDEATEFFRGFVAHGVPVTPSWLLDVFGYALLVAGCPEEGRVFLQKCISLDPNYSYGYLHLGDYFLFRRTTVDLGGSRAAPGKPGSWHAQACYLLAEKVERSKASRVRRIAKARLQLIDQLQRARGEAKSH